MTDYQTAKARGFIEELTAMVGPLAVRRVEGGPEGLCAFNCGQHLRDLDAHPTARVRDCNIGAAGVTVGEDSIVYGCAFHAPVKIGKRSIVLASHMYAPTEIGDGCVVYDTEVVPRSKGLSVGAGCQLFSLSCRAGGRRSLGPGARIAVAGLSGDGFIRIGADATMFAFILGADTVADRGCVVGSDLGAVYGVPAHAPANLSELQTSIAGLPRQGVYMRTGRWTDARIGDGFRCNSTWTLQAKTLYIGDGVQLTSDSDGNDDYQRSTLWANAIRMSGGTRLIATGNALVRIGSLDMLSGSTLFVAQLGAEQDCRVRIAANEARVI